MRFGVLILSTVRYAIRHTGRILIWIVLYVPKNLKSNLLIPFFLPLNSRFVATNCLLFHIWHYWNDQQNIQFRTSQMVPNNYYFINFNYMHFGCWDSGILVLFYVNWIAYVLIFEKNQMKTRQNSIAPNTLIFTGGRTTPWSCPLWTQF